MLSEVDVGSGRSVDTASAWWRNMSDMTQMSFFSSVFLAGSLVVACGTEVPETPEDDGMRITGASSSAMGSTTGASTSVSGAGGAATSTSTGTSSSSAVGGGGGQGGACVDIGLGEPNEAEGAAHALSGDPIEDCDGDGGMVTGVIGPGDSDWFTYIGDDTLGCVVDAQRSFSSDGPLRICKFVRCVDNGATTSFSCPSGTASATSPEGRDGCCGTSGFEIDDVDCSGTLDEDAEVFIRIDRESGTGCTSYSLSYHY